MNVETGANLKFEKENERMNIRIPLILILLMICCGCGRSVTRVSIPIQIESEIDAERYSSFAVLPFVQQKIESAEDNIEIGEEIAGMMRRGIGRHKNYDVVGTQETIRLMTGETIDTDLLEDTSRLGQLGGYFEVDGLITGSYKYYTISQPRTYYGEHYSPTRQQYVMDYQDYLQKTFILALQVMIVDVDTEEIVWDEKYERTAVQNHTLGSFLVSQVAPHDSILKSLTRQAVSEFTRRIAPHYDTEERFLVK